MTEETKDKIDHKYTSNPVCPYCGYVFEDAWEWANGEETDSWEECDCGKKFLWSRNITVDFCTEKSPCLNGEQPHDWKPIHGLPEEYFKNKRRCSMCGEEKKVSDD